MRDSSRSRLPCGAACREPSGRSSLDPSITPPPAPTQRRAPPATRSEAPRRKPRPPRRDVRDPGRATGGEWRRGEEGRCPVSTFGLGRLEPRLFIISRSRQRHGEDGAPSLPISSTDRAPVGLDDSLNDRQAEARASLAAAEEGLEEVRDVRRRQPGTLVLDPDDDVFPVPVDKGRRHGDGATLGRMLDRVREEILEDLLDPPDVERQGRERRRARDMDEDVPVSGEGGRGADAALDHVLEASGTEACDWRLSVVQEVPHELVQPDDLGTQKGHEVRVLVPNPELRLESVEGRRDAEEGVTDLVGNPCDERAEGRHRFAPPEGLLERDDPRDVPHDEDHSGLARGVDPHQARREVPRPRAVWLPGLPGAWRPGRLDAGDELDRLLPGWALPQGPYGLADRLRIVLSHELARSAVETQHAALGIKEEEGRFDSVEGPVPLGRRALHLDIELIALLLCPLSRADVAHEPLGV